MFKNIDYLNSLIKCNIIKLKLKTKTKRKKKKNEIKLTSKILIYTERK